MGKSTLFNYLSGSERSIVTDIAGTTRDVVEESVRLGDITLRLSDTAGIRETMDIIEGIGVDIAKKKLDEADLVIAVFDSSCPLTEDDFELINMISEKKSIAVINKSDEEKAINDEIFTQKNIQKVYLSAKNNEGIEDLQRAVETELKLDEISFEDYSAANERQKQCIEDSLMYVRKAISAIEYGELLDAVTILIDEAENNLLMLTGEKITDSVVDEVFSRFCVGK